MRFIRISVHQGADDIDSFILVGNDKLFVKQVIIFFRHPGYTMLEQPGANPVGSVLADQSESILWQPAVGTALRFIQAILIL